MKFYPGELYHVYNRGNNHQKIFFERENYLFFLKKIRNHLLKHCDLLAWCLMPNHFHLLIAVKEEYMSDLYKNPKLKVAPLNRAISIALSSYTKAFNNMYDRSGSLFQSRTKSKNLISEIKKDDNYALICFFYIHQNPLRAGLVKNLGDWEFSSFRDYSGIRNGDLLKKK